MNFDEIKTLIKSNINDATVEVFDLTGTQDHLGINVVSDSFEGVKLLEQHRMVMDILKTKFDEGLHAVKIKTLTYKKFNGDK